jgi:hypothetical protein
VTFDRRLQPVDLACVEIKGPQVRLRTKGIACLTVPVCVLRRTKQNSKAS